MSGESPQAEDEHYQRVRAAIHDLNNLLNVALANVQLLAREPLEASVLSRLGKAESALSRAAEVVVNLSDLLRRP
jgi:signal transduction histidine kinase